MALRSAEHVASSLSEDVATLYGRVDEAESRVLSVSEERSDLAEKLEAERKFSDEILKKYEQLSIDREGEVTAKHACTETALLEATANQRCTEAENRTLTARVRELEDQTSTASRMSHVLSMEKRLAQLASENESLQKSLDIFRKRHACQKPSDSSVIISESPEAEDKSPAATAKTLAKSAAVSASQSPAPANPKKVRNKPLPNPRDKGPTGKAKATTDKSKTKSAEAVGPAPEAAPEPEAEAAPEPEVEEKPRDWARLKKIKDADYWLEPTEPSGKLGTLRAVESDGSPGCEVGSVVEGAGGRPKVVWK